MGVGWMDDAINHTQTNQNENENVDGTEGIQVVDMLCDAEHTVALTAEGVCMSWGDNRLGQLGLGYCGGERVGSPRRIQQLPQVC